MSFSNPPIGGAVLLRTAEQSANFVTGVSGWQIKRDGTAEFNTGTFRGAITSGPNPGQHFDINPGDGTIVDAYDSSNHKVFVIDPVGNTTWSGYTAGVHTTDTEITASGLFFFSRTDTSEVDVTFDSSTGSSTQADLDILVFNSASPSPNYPYQLTLKAGSDDGTKRPTAVGLERGMIGSLMQSDQISTNNVCHYFAASGTTNSTGFVTLNHGASFRDINGNPIAPNMIICQVHGTGATPSFGTVEVMDGTVTATQFQLYCSQFNGTPRNTGAVTVWGVAVV